MYSKENTLISATYEYLDKFSGIRKLVFMN
jgi:hypothetical protein